MCDYSLMGVPNRLANEGEDLVVHRFCTGSRGLTPQEDFLKANPGEQMRFGGFQSIVRTLFGILKTDSVAVCIPPGTRLLLGDIPEDVQNSLQVGPIEEVTFTQLTAKPNTYRDAVRFKNGHELLIQQLKDGERVKVLELPLEGAPDHPIGKAAESFR